MRLFVGIELGGALRDEVMRVRNGLVGPLTRQGVRFVRPEKLHLTLCFLGSVPDGVIEDLTSQLHGIAAKSMNLQLTEIGCFPSRKRPKVIWLGLAGEREALERLADAVVAVAKPLAKELDDKPFVPHITLARISPGSQEVGRLLEGLKPSVEPAATSVTEFCLFHSVPDGSYAIIDRFPLR